ncbi:hypothetical protein [Hoyosella altamirensis]|uniref:DUF2273 domain-containing protein n=1 Tax=Hoyosella altamirensis TaxID=616997 RepID=A0A839RMN3_9ACTN|nr:hypothetical protein [Hoyosella altamirensis]MBB3037770.1 hypothetical protein [Hoyosella altamirensis]
MSNAQIGLLAGLLLAIAAILGGLGGFLLAVVFAAAATALGAHRDGSIDLGALLRGRIHG